jgi:hypothetical protein
LRPSRRDLDDLPPEWIEEAIESLEKVGVSLRGPAWIPICPVVSVFIRIVLLFGQEVAPSELDDVVVVWTDGKTRRAILDSGYAGAHAVLERVLGRFDGGARHYANLRAKVGDLADSGTAITLVLDHHRVGLLRPYLIGEPGPEPYVVCRETRGMLRMPVICASQQDAHSFARSASQETGLSGPGWLGFEGERLPSPIARLLTPSHDGRVRLRSALEEALSASLAEDRAAAVTPPDIRAYRTPAIRARRTTSPKRTV